MAQSNEGNINNSEMFSVTYNKNGVEYVVTDTFDVHQLLSNDPHYFEQYFDTHLHSLEISKITSPTDVVDNTGRISESFVWTPQTTKLLLVLYQERKAAFRDPKIKKKKLWSDIREKFVQKGYASITEDCLDRKMRNMKKTYRTIKDNNKKSSTGRGRVSWEHFDTFEDIFADDCTINIGSTLSSLSGPQQTEQEWHAEENTNSLPSDSEHNLQFFPYIPDSINSSPTKDSPSSSSSSSSIVHSHFSAIFTLDDTALLPQRDSIDEPCTSNSSQDFLHTRTPKISNRPIRHKGLYLLRKEQLQLEVKRVQALQDLAEKIDTANKIQQRRNELLEMLLLQRSNREGEGQNN